MAGLSGRTGGGRDPDAIAIDVNLLIGERDDDQQRPAGRSFGKPVEFAVPQVLGIFGDELAEAEPIRAQTPRNQGQSHEIGDA